MSILVAGSTGFVEVKLRCGWRSANTKFADWSAAARLIPRHRTCKMLELKL